MQPNSPSASLWPLRLSGALFVLYAGNILVGKLSVTGGSDVVGIGDVAEFLALFGAVASFVVAVLIKEREEAVPPSPGKKQT